MQTINSSTQGLPYQIESLMHFCYNEYSIWPDEFTMVSKQRIELLSSQFPTTLDYMHINLLYCNGKEKNWNAFMDGLKLFCVR